MFFNKKILVSICIPVFESEAFLEKCLDSITKQDFLGLEVIVVDDGSSSDLAEGIVKAYKKKTKFAITFIKHEKNKGLLEARRTAVYEAKGDFILILDSDDTLSENGVKALYEEAVKTGADIIHGKADAVYTNNTLEEIDKERSEDYRQEMLAKINNISEQDLTGTDIFDGFLVKINHQGFLWGKLFRKEVYLEALAHIPPIYCTMAEDFIQYFWISLFAQKYVGINQVVYNYSINTGISSRTVIKDLERWEKVCSTASVFTAIFSELESSDNIKLTEEQADALRLMCRTYVRNNLEQLKVAVAPELQEEAKNMLYEYWGKDLINKIGEGK